MYGASEAGAWPQSSATEESDVGRLHPRLDGVRPGARDWRHPALCREGRLPPARQLPQTQERWEGEHHASAQAQKVLFSKVSLTFYLDEPVTTLPKNPTTILCHYFFLLKFDCLIIHMLQNKSRQYMRPQCKLHEECTRTIMLSIIKMFIFLNIFTFKLIDISHINVLTGWWGCFWTHGSKNK